MRGVDRASPLFQLPIPKINLIYGPRVGDISDIKLIRTDTTLDLSQKAEKRCQKILPGGSGAPSAVTPISGLDKFIKRSHATGASVKLRGQCLQLLLGCVTGVCAAAVKVAVRVVNLFS